MAQTVYLQYANSSSDSQSMSPYWSTLQIIISILLNKLKCKQNEMNEMKLDIILSKSLIKTLKNIEFIRLAPGRLLNMAFAFLWQA